MAGVRSDGQKQVIVMMRETFVEKIDASMPHLGYNDRASLIRDAVYKMLREHQVDVTPEDKTAPGRAGKGGRPKSEITPSIQENLKMRKQELMKQLQASQIEQAAIMERVSTPEAQDAIMSIRDKSQRLKTVKQLEDLKSEKKKKPPTKKPH